MKTISLIFALALGTMAAMPAHANGSQFNSATYASRFRPAPAPAVANQGKREFQVAVMAMSPVQVQGSGVSVWYGASARACATHGR
jgi:hypothetical protein